MINNGYRVEEVTNNPNFWSKDIDFIVTSPFSGEQKTFEVKFDSKINRTGNLYLEFLNAHSNNCSGWFEFCKADYLAYGDAVTEEFYVVPMPELRAAVQSMPKRVAYCGNDSAGYLVPLTAIADIT